MKRVIGILILSFVLFAGCSPTTLTTGDSAMDSYLATQPDFIEPICEEWENEGIVIENNTLYAVHDSKQEQLLDEVVTWAPFSDHSILVVYKGNTIVEVNLVDLTQTTIYEAPSKIVSLNTDGTLIFFVTEENEIFRYFVPSNEADLIATDGMFVSLLSPFSTTDICWLSYNPQWLKAFYELGNEDDIYNIKQTVYTFCDTTTKEAYLWEPETALDDYSVQGLEWYSEIKKSNAA